MYIYAGFVDTILSLLPEAHKYEASVAQEEGATLLNQGNDKRTVRQVILKASYTLVAQGRIH